ncbi:DUF2680 domain-containing protein [Bacillus marasmi]|uniref:DUF2680 domain-containing protein n=1 Tax=Bacillus marasmi TaxID=1926279 RepID=UPI0011C849FE|nr:DUF2680 domain-containing protein [Bacillus marasmi]
MKMKQVLIAGVFVGAFGLGAMFAPIGEPAATTSNNQVLKAVNTATEQTPKDDVKGYTCPMTGEEMGRGGAGMGKGMGMGMQFGGEMHETVADVLGMTVYELQAARSEGKTIADLATEKGISTDDLVAKLVEVRKANLDQLKKEGKITQEQMDRMLTNMESRMKAMIENGGGASPLNGNCGGKMGQNGQGGWFNKNVENQQID